MDTSSWTLLNIGAIILLLAAAVVMRKLVVLLLSFLPIKRLLGEHTTKVLLFVYALFLIGISLYFFFTSRS